MKKITTLALVLLASQTFADTTGTLLLQGEVAEELAIVVTPEAGHDSLDLSASPTDLKVASVNEKSNSNTGYNIQVKSANAGELKNGTLDSLLRLWIKLLRLSLVALFMTMTLMLISNTLVSQLQAWLKVSMKIP